MSSTGDRSLLVILNGKSAGKENVREAVQKIREEGYATEVRVTWEYGDGARYVKEAIQSGVDVIVAGGGDGTINEVANGILSMNAGPDIAMAVLPLGTANDFATGCGVPIGDPLAALQLAATGEIAAIDVGKANDEFFINMASVGFGAEVTVSTPSALKKAIGGAAYLVTGIATAFKMKPHRCKVTLPDGRSQSGDVFVMTVGNGKQCGGGQVLAPKALLNDGLLDALFVHDVSIESFGTMLTEWLSLSDEKNQNVSYLQTESFWIECDDPLQVNLDGEPVKESRFEFRAIPGALKMVLPETAPLVR